MKKLMPLLALTAFFNTSAVLARTNADELQALHEQILMLTSRLDELEKAQQQTTLSHAQAQATTTAAVEEVIEVIADAVLQIVYIDLHCLAGKELLDIIENRLALAI